jgi:hypothetical protein
VAETVGQCVAGPLEWALYLEYQDREGLEWYGKILDQRPASLCERTVGMALVEKLLQVRTREGRTAPLLVRWG